MLGLVKVSEVVQALRRRVRSPRTGADESWFRTIVLEGSIPDLRHFLQTQKEALKDAASGSPGMAAPYFAALMRYARASEELKIRLQPLQDLSVHAHATIIRALEDLDDRVAPFCPHGDDPSFSREMLAAEGREVEVQFARCLRDCLAVLRDVHFELSCGRDPDQAIPMPVA